MGRKKESPTARSSDKRRKAGPGDCDTKMDQSRSPLRAGMPAKDSIIAEVPFTSPKGKTYRIIKTDEMDEYDEKAQPKRERRQK